MSVFVHKREKWNNVEFANSVAKDEAADNELPEIDLLLVNDSFI